MTEKELLNKLSSEIEDVKPVVIKKVIKKCIKEDMITLNKKMKFALGGLTLAVLCVFGGLIVNYNRNLKGSTMVAMDVNPSIELLLNSKQKVVELKALNNDALKIVDGMDFKGSDYKLAVNALIGSMLKNGFITDISNSILLSVDGNDKNIEKDLMTYVNTVLTENNINGAIVGQTLEKKDDETKKLAEKYGISLGKATLIKQIIAKDKSQSWDKLSKLNINELNLISSATIGKLENINTTGKPSDKSYIGEVAAKAIALKHLGIPESAVKLIVSDLDSENGIMVYEVDFTYNGFEYDYEINASTGVIIN
ncbi:MAG: PepSY domain-containing protein, partial [Bacilli bacterium]